MKDPLDEVATIVRLGPEQQRWVTECAIVPPIARAVRAQYRDADLDELMAIGRACLVRIAPRFDPSRGVPFDGFAWQPVHFAMVKACQAARKHRVFGWASAHHAVYDRMTDARDEGDVLHDSDDEQRRQVRELSDTVAAAAFCGFASSSVSADSPEERLAAHQLYARAMEALRELLAEMPVRERSVLELRYFQGRTFDDIAAVTGGGNSTVRRWHRDALTMLATRLQRRGVAEPPPSD